MNEDQQRIMADVRKYRAYKLRQTWYGQCPHCSVVKINGSYDHMIDLLELHARDDHPQVLDNGQPGRQT